ncbi:MAG TPA: ABC transporter substrate-binding protein [Candidatus Binatia bacterium]|nr:ABC transporter substrate-binding protein [Candidatus Binatia bacterium]
MAFLAIVITFAMCGVEVEAQQPKKVHRIGYLSAFEPVYESPRAEAIRSALRELSHVEGQNIVTEYRYTEGKRDRFRELAAELVRLKVDVIVVAGGFGPIQAARNATKTIPIVMAALSGDPVELGLVESLARPGGNVTGITTLSRELGGKRLELLKEAATKIARVAVLYDSTLRAGPIEVKEDIPVAARALGLMVRSREVGAADDVEKVFAALSKERTDGLYVTSGGLMTRNQNKIASLALKNRLPSVFSNREGVDVGGLLYYGADIAASYRRVAYFVDRILQGAKPADLPVEQPTKFEFVINLKTAKQIGVTIPQSLLYRADKVIR